MLVLAHRQELLDQARNHLRTANPLLRVDIEQADRWADDNADVVVASVQTLGRAGGRRLERMRNFDAVVIDEAHHATADTYVRIMRHCGVGEADGPVLVGVTATPFRGDKASLANVFDQVVYEKSLRAGIEENWLATIRAVRVQSQTNLSNVSTRLGDFAETELAEATNTDYRNSLIASAIEQHAPERSCILIFGVDVKHVEALTAQLSMRGHATEMVTGFTPQSDRWRIFDRFADGRTRILVNCGVCTEGYDNPRIDCLVMARPTKSSLLFQQCLGRGTRRTEGKPDCLVIDVVDVCGRHHVQTAATAFGLRDLDLLGGDVLEAVETCEEAEALGVPIFDGETVEDVKERSNLPALVAKGTVYVETRAQAINLFAAGSPSPEVEADSEFPWMRMGQDRYVLAIDRARHAVLHRDTLGIWSVDLPGEGGLNCGDDDAPPWDEADRVVKRMAGKFVTGDGVEVPMWKVLSNQARWKQQAPTDKQVAQLKRMGVLMLPDDLTRGAASQMITHLFTLRREMQT